MAWRDPQPDPRVFPWRRDFAGDGLDMGHEFAADEAASKARRVDRRALRARLVKDGERTYAAYSAHELFEIESQASRERPGHLW